MKKIILSLVTLYFLSLYSSHVAAEGLSWVLVLIGGCFLVKDLKAKKQIAYSKFLLGALLVLFLTAVISFFVNPKLANVGDSVFKFRWMIPLLFIPPLLSQNIEKYLSLFLKVTILALPLLAIVCFYQFFTGGDLLGRDPQYIAPYGQYFRAAGRAGPLTTSYLVGISILFLMPLFFFKTVHSRFINKTTILFAALSGVAIIFTTLSRGPLLVLPVAIFFVICFVNIKKAALFSAITALLIAIMIPTTGAFKNRLINNATTDTSASERFKVMRMDFEIFKDHPIFGVGFGNPQKLSVPYYDKLGYEHGQGLNSPGNFYFEFLASLGILGFLSFLSICFLFFKYNWRTFKDASDPAIKGFALALFGAQIYIYLSGFIEGHFFAVQPRLMILAIWTLVLALKLYCEQKKSHKPI